MTYFGMKFLYKGNSTKSHQIKSQIKSIAYSIHLDGSSIILW